MIKSYEAIKDRKSPLDVLVDTGGLRVGVTALTGTRAMRQLNAVLMDLAVYLGKHPEDQAVLMLEEPEISFERFNRLEAELLGVFRQEILERLSIRIVQEDGRTWEIWEEEKNRPSSMFSREDTRDILKRIRSSKPALMRRPSDSFYEVLRILLVHWFRGDGFATKKSLQQEAGYSFDTIQRALKALDIWCEEDSAKSVRLEAFPESAWNRLVNMAEDVRATAAYTVSGGEARPVDMMIQKLVSQEFYKGRVAIGGIEAARFYDPGFDLVGSPRLDLCVDQKKPFDTGKLLRKLDPALRPAGKGEAPVVVLHTLCRNETFFRLESGRLWVDEVECLLDLFEARLTSQASHLLNRFCKGAAS